jgi:hypothetical protein
MPLVRKRVREGSRRALQRAFTQMIVSQSAGPKTQVLRAWGVPLSRPRF